METLRKWYTGADQSKPVPKPVVAVFGAMAGGCSVLGNTPIDGVKTRMQNGSYSSTLVCQAGGHEGGGAWVLQRLLAQDEQGLLGGGPGLLYL